MLAHIPALIVVIPLIGAPTCMLLRYRGWSWGVALIGSWMSFTLSWLLLQQVMAQGVVTYELGGWVAPLGTEYSNPIPITMKVAPMVPMTRY